MDFSFNDEQQMLLETTRRLIAKDYTFAHRMKIREADAGWSRDTWMQLADLGLLALTIPEDDGGIGAGAIGAMLVSNAIGEGLLLEPFHASAIVATQVIVQLGNAAQRAAWLASMASGETIGVLAHADANSDAGVEATPVGDGWTLSGVKHGVYHGDIADLLLVSARIKGSDTLALFAVPATSQGVTRHGYRTVDDQRAANLSFEQVHVATEARLGEDVTAELEAAVDFGLAALCAEAVGALSRILAATIDYSRQRSQFGVPIGSFQALQHRMADMLMYVEQARSISYLATSRCTDADAGVRRAALSAAKVSIGQAARFVGQQAVQIHGGMGMTDELDVSHYFKRLTAFELRGGTTDAHLRSYAKGLRKS
jgi:alkylation response protein AidB-like acyl-CoA dehydrogenase